MKSILSKLFIIVFGLFLNFSFFSLADNNAVDVLDKVSPNVIKNNIPNGWGNGKWAWVNMAQKLIVDTIWYWIILPIMVVVGILLAIISFFSLMFSDKEEEQKKSLSRIVWWVIWLLISWSAVFIASNFAKKSWQLVSEKPATIATLLYDKVIASFLKIGLYLAPAILFIILLLHVFKFITSPSEEVKSHSQKIIVWNIFGIIVILMSTYIVEFIMWPRAVVTSYNPTTWDIWFWIFSLKPQFFEFIVSIIKLILSITAFVILAIIIYQAYLLLFKPEDQETYKKIKRNFLYVLIWATVLFGVYLFVNFLIVK